MIRLGLVADWRRAHRWASVQLAALFGLLAGFLAAYPTALQELLAYVPDEWRPLAKVAIAVIAFVVPTLARVLKRKPKAPADEPELPL